MSALQTSKRCMRSMLPWQPKQSVHFFVATPDLCSLREVGVRIFVKEIEWKLTRSQLSSFAVTYGRFKKRTMARDDFAKGKHRSRLVRWLPFLTKKGVIDEDKSRVGHQLQLSPEAHTIAGRMRGPEAYLAQVELADLLIDVTQ
jgi:hypothetical protein